MPDAPASAPAKPTTPSGTPRVSVESIAPAKVNIGEPLRYEIVVKNTGTVPVSQVRVEDELAPGSEYLGGEPIAQATGSRLAWSIGTLDAGQTKRLHVEVRPSTEAEFHHQATAFFATSTAGKIKITRPKLGITVTAPEKTEVGDVVPFQITVSNSGDGPATKFLLRAQLSAGLQHPQGSVIEAELAHLKPGENRVVTLKTLAVRGGPQALGLNVAALGSPEAMTRVELQVDEPRLALKQTGPVRCLVRAEPTFAVEVTNPGNTSTAAVTVTTTLPEGLDFVSANDGGTFDAKTRSVVWNLPPHPPGMAKQLSVKTKAKATGDFTLRTVAKAGTKLETKAETALRIEGVPALLFEVVDLEDTIEVDKETTYEVRIVNQGTCACTNISLMATLSDGLKPTAITSPMPYRIVGQQIVFEPYAKLATKADVVVRMRVKGLIPGDHRCRVQIQCDEIRQPIIKEESTRFYKE